MLRLAMAEGTLQSYRTTLMSEEGSLMSHMTKLEIRDPDAGLRIDDAHRAMWEEHRRNFDFFVEHGTALFAQHPDEWLLIHSGGQVEAFDDLGVLFDRRSELAGVQRKAAMIERRKAAAWLL